MDDRAILTALFEAAIEAADPKVVLKDALPEKPKGRTIVIGAGKGAAQLGQAFEELWDGPLEGLIVTRYGYAVPCNSIEVIEAAHPVPDAAGATAAARMMDLVSDLTPDDLVVALITGGGSALLPLPAGDLTLEDEQALNRALLASGAPISVMNRIRKHTSGIKGGRLAMAAAPAKVVTLIVSDVPGDAPHEVASGPTVASMGDVAGTLDIIRARNLVLPPSIVAHLDGDRAEAPDPGDPVFDTHETKIIASAGLSLEAAAARAEEFGLSSVILSDRIEGEAADVGGVHAALALEVQSRDRPFKAPVVILSGGETTVTLSSVSGRGGRNSEFMLAFADAIDGATGITALAADSDGIDGSEENAGAFADGVTCLKIRAAGVDPVAALGRHDAWTAFSAIDGLFVTGPTGTNVNDFRAIIVRR